jgi:hypothetical protein
MQRVFHSFHSHTIRPSPIPPLPAIPNANTQNIFFSTTVTRFVYRYGPTWVPVLWYNDKKGEWEGWSKLAEGQRQLHALMRRRHALGQNARREDSELKPATTPGRLSKLWNMLMKKSDEIR